MIIKQLTVFIENKCGRINDVTKVLSDNGINMEAFCVAETADFGLLRLIVKEVDKAAEALRAADFAVILTDVLCINCVNEPGALSKVLEKLASHNIFIDYMYAFAQTGNADVIIKTNDTAKSVEVLSSCSDCIF